jgi:hypothetical protein
MDESSKDEPSTRTVKRTILFRPEDWERIEAAARKLTGEIHAEVSEPEFIRGAVARRCDEVLNVAA